MTLELKQEEKTVLRHALEVYLHDLRGEILRTDRREWKEGLHKEEDLLREVFCRLN